MDKYINSPPKKTKQTSLSDFYRKPQYQENHLSNAESPSSISLTPSKLKSHDHDSTKFAGKITTTMSNSRAYHPLISTDQYKTLDINSNMKLKIDDMFTAQQQSTIKPNNNNIIIQQPVYQQNIFAKPSQSYLTKNQPQNLHQQNSQLMTKKFDNSYIDLDLNLSVEPQEIRIPQVKRYENLVNQFRLHDDDRLEGNFLITPENSLIKSPEKYLPIETRHFTPLNSDKYQDRQPPSSEIIQRLRFNTEQLQTTDKKTQYQYQENQQKSPKKIPQSSQPFDKHLQSSPTSAKKSTTNIPSPRKSPSKRSPSIHEQSPTKSSNTKQNNQILSSDDQDSTQLLSKIRQLQSQVSSLKTHKYEFAISKYRQQTRYELQKHLQTALKSINFQYDSKEQQLKKQAELQTQQYMKSIDDIAKYKKTYAIILAQLKENRQKIDDEYRQKVDQVKKYKQKLINDWKRQSNQQIKKIINNTHTKHSTKLSSSKQKSKDVSREKLPVITSKDRISPFNSTK